MNVTHSTHDLHNTSVIVIARVASPSCVSSPLPRLSPLAPRNRVDVSCWSPNKTSSYSLTMVRCRCGSSTYVLMAEAKRSWMGRSSGTLGWRSEGSSMAATERRRVARRAGGRDGGKSGTLWYLLLLFFFFFFVNVRIVVPETCRPLFGTYTRRRETRFFAKVILFVPLFSLFIFSRHNFRNQKKSLHQKEDATTTTTECVLPTPPPNTRRRVSDHHHRPPPKKESHYARRRLVSVFSLEQKSVALKRDLLLRRRDID